MRLYEVIENQYSEIEFVCHNEQHPDSTQTDSQQALMRDLQNMKGVVVLCQDWSSEHDGRQISLSAIVLDRSLLPQVKAAARRHDVEIDMVNKVNDDYVNRAIRGEHDGQVMEGRFRNAAFAGITAASLAGAVHNAHKFDDTHDGPAPKNTITRAIDLPTPKISSYVEPEIQYDAEDEYDGTEDNLRDVARAIAKKYRVSENLVNDIVILAHKYEDAVFPKAIDILAVIAVESSFNPTAVSQLRRDPARGLMQVRPGVWGVDISDLDNIENQIRIGTRILKRYYARTQNPDSALQAYNVGITNYRKGIKNPRYLQKVNTARQYLASYMTRT